MSADGKWDVTMNTPMGAQKGVLTLTTSGDGVTGTLEIKEGKVDGNSLSWSVDMTSPMPMKLGFTATVDGDKISGDVDLGSFGKATFEGARA